MAEGLTGPSAQKEWWGVISVVTDSCADLPPDLLDRYGIEVLPFRVHCGDRECWDGVDLDSTTVFRMVEETGDLPRTAAPSVAEYAAAFDRPGEVVFVGIGSALSVGMQNALLAAREYPVGKVHVVDSRNLSTGIGHLAILAAEMRDAGLPAAAIARALEAAAGRVRTAFVVDTLAYLHKGGRCTALASLVGSVLRIRPVVAVQPDGTLGVRQRLRGSRRRALQALLDDLARHRERLDPRRVFVTHAGAEDAGWLAHEVQRVAAPQETLITEAGCTISAHCGPNTIGILYMTR